MKTLPLIRKISMSLLINSFFVVVNKVKDIIKVFDVILSIPFKVVLGTKNKVFILTALTFLHYLYIKYMVSLERFCDVSVTVNKYDEGNVSMGAMEKVINLGCYWL